MLECGRIKCRRGGSGVDVELLFINRETSSDGTTLGIEVERTLRGLLISGGGCDVFFAISCVDEVGHCTSSLCGICVVVLVGIGGDDDEDVDFIGCVAVGVSDIYTSHVSRLPKRFVSAQVAMLHSNVSLFAVKCNIFEVMLLFMIRMMVFLMVAMVVVALTSIR